MGAVAEFGVKMNLRFAISLSFIALAACSLNDSSEPVTLYRNSQIDNSMRIHFATFNADDSGQYYNLANCRMASKVLNANVRQLNPTKEKQHVGFWCEEGMYQKDGPAVSSYDAEFPTSVK
jgi:hypothetical protein